MLCVNCVPIPLIADPCMALVLGNIPLIVEVGRVSEKR